MNSQISGLEEAVKRRPQTFSLRKNLIQLLLLRTKLLGTYIEDFDRALVIAEDGVDRDEQSIEALILQAEVFSALHRFTDAEQCLEEAANEGATEYQMKDLIESINLARGENLLQLAAKRRVIVIDNPNFSSYTELALSEASIGNFEAADTFYEKALSLYRDSSPIPVAILNFQRGVMWCEMAGQCDRALSFYLKAVAQVPQYVSANVHLAELEFQNEESSSALGRLKSIVKDTSDAEPTALLSEIYFANGDLAEGYRSRDKASRLYEQLLALYEPAFRDHAAEFFMGTGANANRAFDLAVANLKNRKSERAYTLALEAALRSGDTHFACETSAKISSPVTSPLQQMLQALDLKCRAT